MIESLHIEDLGVIEEADLVLSPGLTALTGETGAGKTMVLTSLGLLLGQRAESTIVRAGAGRALVEGVFTLDGDSPATRRAAEAGAELEDDQLAAFLQQFGQSGQQQIHPFLRGQAADHAEQRSFRRAVELELGLQRLFDGPLTLQVVRTVGLGD